MNKALFQSATDAARMLSRREISSRELTEMLLARIDIVNPGFHVRLFFAFQQPGADSAKLSEFIDHETRRMTARAAWNRYFNDTDVFLCPANFTPAFPHDTRPFEERTITTPEGERPYDSQAFWVSHASLPGLPAVAAPIGLTPRGLPVGAQIVGPLYEDDTAITFAELLGDVIGGYEPPPV
jgi:amidase